MTQVTDNPQNHATADQSIYVHDRDFIFDQLRTHSHVQIVGQGQVVKMSGMTKNHLYNQLKQVSFLMIVFLFVYLPPLITVSFLPFHRVMNKMP